MCVRVRVTPLHYCVQYLAAIVVVIVGDEIWLHLEHKLRDGASYKPKRKSTTNCCRRRQRVVCQKVALVVKVISCVYSII